MKPPKLPSGVSIYKDGPYWVLRLGKRYTGGRPTRKKFGKMSEAVEAFDKEKDRREALGTAGYQLSVSQTAEAIHAFQRLEGTGMQLSEAVEHALKGFRRKEQIIPLADAVESFIATQRERGAAEATVKTYRVFLKRLQTSLPPRIGIHEITEAHVRTLLTSWERVSSRNIALRHLRAFFNYAVKRGWRVDTPAQHIDHTRETESPVAILTLKQCRTIMDVCAADAVCRPYLAALAVQLFAGLRASEVDRLDWSDISLDLPNPHLKVTARKQRSRQRRIVSIGSNLRDWLLPIAQDFGKVVPPLARKCHEHLQEAAGLKPWKKDILRHTFGSYHLAFFQNESQTALEMGNSPTVIYQHYREVVRAQDAKLFWKICPAEIRAAA